MRLIIEDLAKQCQDKIYNYNLNYSLSYAIEVQKSINKYINSLEHSPYLGSYVQEIPNKNFRWLLYKKSRRSAYRIIYYISEIKDTIYIIYILNCKQDFNHILEDFHYFNNYFNL